MYPAELKYTKDHEWVRVSGAQGRVGITDYAQKQLGDVQPAHGDPAEQRQLAGALLGREAEGLDEDRHADDERGGDGGDAEPVAPRVGTAPPEQQHEGAEGRQRG